jgi:hypothetical protein
MEINMMAYSIDAQEKIQLGYRRLTVLCLDLGDFDRARHWSRKRAEAVARIQGLLDEQQRWAEARKVG